MHRMQRSPVLAARLALFSLAASSPAFAADVACDDPAPTPPPSGICSVTAGDDGRLLRGTVLLPDGVATNGSVMVDVNGTIVCAGCGCQAAEGADTATRIDCANGVISPGLIDLRNQIASTQNAPVTDTGERYEHRHDWRKGQNSHTQINVPGGATTDQLRWGELRELIVGVTAMNSGTGGVAGLVRNLGRTVTFHGLSGASTVYETFPLNDSGSGFTADSGCDGYGTLPALPPAGRFAFVAAEGINAAARNEFLCLSGLEEGGVDVLGNTSVAGAIALRASDAAALAAHEASVIWQPRDDLRLYGMTAPVTVFDNAGVPLALATVWTPTGSMSLQREMRCADSYNAAYLDHHFSDEALWRMATQNAAVAAGFGSEIGRLAPTLKADVAVFDASSRSGYRAVVGADVADVVLVLRSGLPMYGEAAVLSALGAGDGVCDAIEVCGSQRRVCVTRETGQTLALLTNAVGASTYPLFFCGEPVDEPVCKPQRLQGAPNNIAPFFSGDPTANDGDGDGVPDASDVCPAMFDPPRPADGAVQPDEDHDGIGDACDPCPLDADNACDTLFKDGFDAVD
jgi:hypothetical protein